MSFLNPLFLGALALALIPLLIHLLRRRKLPVVKWAAMEFLLQSQRKQRRRIQIEEWLLLFIRMLIISCIVLALSRPLLKSIVVHIPGQNGRVYAVIVLDNSLSMSQRLPGSKSAWDRAKADTHQLLTRLLQQGDSVSILLMNGSTVNLVEGPSFDLNAASRKVANTNLSDGSTDYLTAARMVLNRLQKVNAPYPEVFWISDDQRVGWPQDKNLRASNGIWKRISKIAPITWVSAGLQPADRNNIAVHLQSPDRELVTPDLPAHIQATVSNFSPRAANIVAEMSIDGGTPAQPQQIHLDPYSSSNLLFTPYFPTPGEHTGAISVSSGALIDVLAKDNTADFVIKSEDHIPVLVDDLSAAGTYNASFWLAAALQPDSHIHIFSPHFLAGTQYNSTPLSRYATVILTGVNSISPSEAAALATYTRMGGGVLIFPGAHPNLPELNSVLNANDILPARLSNIQQLSSDSAVTLDSGSITSSSPLALFKDTSQVDIGSSHFSHYIRMVPSTDSSPSGQTITLVKFSSGYPALVETRVGLGKVMFFASTADTSWNDLPKHAATWLPLLYQILADLSSGADSHRNLQIGDPIQLSLPLAASGRKISVTLPNNQVITSNSVLGPNGVSFQFNDTLQAGIYHVHIPGGASETFCVNLPLQESDLKPFTDIRTKLITAGVTPSKLTTVSTEKELAQAVKHERYGQELWRTLILIAILLLFIESPLARYIGRR